VDFRESQEWFRIRDCDELTPRSAAGPAGEPATWLKPGTADPISCTYLLEVALPSGSPAGPQARSLAPRLPDFQPILKPLPAEFRLDHLIQEQKLPAAYFFTSR